MLNIYTVPLSNRNTKTLQADGATWEALAHMLREQEKTHHLGLLYEQLPAQFSRSEILRLTFQNKHANQLLEVAGISS